MTATELATLLADPSQGGAYFVDARDRAALVEAAAALGFAVLPTDLIGVHDKAAGLARIAQALALPAWFGGNWDALQDCLDDMSWHPAPGYLLLFDHSGDWREGDDAGFATLLEVLDEAARRRGEASQPFWAVLPLPTEPLEALAPSRNG